MMKPPHNGSSPLPLTRRQMVQTSGLGIGSLALSYLLHAEGLLAAENRSADLKPKAPHFAANGCGRSRWRDFYSGNKSAPAHFAYAGKLL